jgi:signal transduction histidine kinase
MRGLRGSLQFKFVSAIICIVVPLLGIIFLWQGVAEERQAWTQVVNQARVLTRQIILTRQWVSDSQGIYLRTDTFGARGGGGFYSDLLPTERGVMQRFTPSMVTKQLSVYSYRQNLYRFRLAGIAPMNPENRPDEFELAAITSFSQDGNKEYYTLSDHDGEAVFQYSAPLYVDETCLSCHKNYTSGTVSGCLSIHLPVQHVLDSLKSSRMQLFTSASALIILTVLTLYFLVRHLVLKPLGTLEAVADGISLGHFPGPISIGSSVEMDRVGQALGSMSSKLEESRNRLEEEVQSATSELALANEELKTLDRLKSEFLATMSHELRSPLTSIRGGLDYLRRTETATDRQDYLGIMDKNLRRLVHLVTDIFDITRIEAQKVQWRFAPADLTELVGEIVEIMTPLAEDHGLRMHFLSPGPMHADIDVERIEQVIVNLTDNAIKYSPKGGLISFAVLHENGELQVQVRDQGPGIPAADRELIFKKFHTAPSSGRADKPGGTGLGLAICSQIVRAHGGRIWVEDNPEGGSVFTFALPAKEIHSGKT